MSEEFNLFDSPRERQCATKGCDTIVQAYAGADEGKWFVPPFCATCVEALDREEEQQQRKDECEIAIKRAGIGVRAAKVAKKRSPVTPDGLASFARRFDVEPGDPTAMVVVGDRHRHRRTYLLQHLVAEIVREHLKVSKCSPEGTPRAKSPCVFYTTEAKMLEALAQQQPSKFYQAAHLLVIDDFGSTPTRDWVVSRFKTVLEARHEAGRPTIFGCDVMLSSLVSPMITLDMTGLINDMVWDTASGVLRLDGEVER